MGTYLPTKKDMIWSRFQKFKKFQKISHKNFRSDAAVVSQQFNPDPILGGAVPQQLQQLHGEHPRHSQVPLPLPPRQARLTVKGILLFF
jgi:hypothetical protein